MLRDAGRWGRRGAAAAGPERRGGGDVSDGGGDVGFGMYTVLVICLRASTSHFARVFIT